MNHDIDNILEKYWNGETSIEEENAIKEYMLSDNVAGDHQSYIALFRYFDEEKNLDYEFVPDLSFAQSKKNKLRFIVPRVIAIAASLLLLFTINKIWIGNSSDTIYKNKYTELQNPEEALQITLDALGFVGHNLDKGTKEVSHMKQFEKTAVFNFDK